MGAVIRLNDGSLIPVGKHMSSLTQQELMNTLVGKLHSEIPDQEGKTFMDELASEVVNDALYSKSANVKIAARAEIFDRILGKPKQAVETVNVSVSLNDLLDKIAKEESGIIDTNVTPSILDDL